MKKRTILPVSILLILVLALLFSSCSLFKPKTMLTAEEFKTLMEGAGYTVEDVTAQYDEGSADTVLIAYNEDYQIEFYALSTTDQAEEAFRVNKQTFEDTPGVKSNTELNGSNFNYFAATTSDSYLVVSRVENTFIYVEEAAEFKDDIKEALNLLGY